MSKDEMYKILIQLSKLDLNVILKNIPDYSREFFIKHGIIRPLIFLTKDGIFIDGAILEEDGKFCRATVSYSDRVTNKQFIKKWVDDTTDMCREKFDNIWKRLKEGF